MLSKYSTEVYLIYRGKKIYRPEPVLLRHLDESKNINILLNTKITKIIGNNEYFIAKNKKFDYLI